MDFDPIADAQILAQNKERIRKQAESDAMTTEEYLRAVQAKLRRMSFRVVNGGKSN